MTDQLSAILTFSNGGRATFAVCMGPRAGKGLIARGFSKFSKNCPKAICRTVRVQVKLIFNCTRTFPITCLSPVEHRGHYVTDQ